MKKAAGTLRLDLAQYREMETFSQFAGDMDEATTKQIRYGEGLMKVLKQKQNSPMTLTEQVFTLVIATMDKFEHINPADADVRMKEIVQTAMSACQDIVVRIENEGVLSDEDKRRIYETVVNTYG